MTNAFGSFAAADASGGECVISHDNAVAAMGNINACRVVLDVGPSQPFKPEVERVVAAIEAAQILVFGQLLDDELGDPAAQEGRSWDVPSPGGGSVRFSVQAEVAQAAVF